MILVTGATSHAGRAAVCRLASLGHDVVAMVRDVQAASRRLPSGIALRVAAYEDASALKRTLAGIDDMVLISSGGDASPDCIASSPFSERHRSGTDILEFTIPRWLCIMHR